MSQTTADLTAYRAGVIRAAVINAGLILGETASSTIFNVEPVESVGSYLAVTVGPESVRAARIMRGGRTSAVLTFEGPADLGADAIIAIASAL